jgi:hypothetical protein
MDGEINLRSGGPHSGAVNSKFVDIDKGDRDEIHFDTVLPNTQNFLKCVIGVENERHLENCD